MKLALSNTFSLIIVKEWIECGEFKNTDKIIVVGNRFCATGIKFLFRGSGKKIYYCSKKIKKYRYRSKTKWIVFDNSLKKIFPQNSYDVLIIPTLGY